VFFFLLSIGIWNLGALVGAHHRLAIDHGGTNDADGLGTREELGLRNLETRKKEERKERKGEQTEKKERRVATGHSFCFIVAKFVSNIDAVDGVNARAKRGEPEAWAVLDHGRESANMQKKMVI
jgi:hypothetical protein